MYEADIEHSPVLHVRNDDQASKGKTFHITVSQHKVNGKVDGTLDIAFVDADGNATPVPTFTNQYEATGHVNVFGTKTLSGRSLLVNDPWTFTVARASVNADAPLRLRTTGGTAQCIMDSNAVIVTTSPLVWQYGFSLHYDLEDLAIKDTDGNIIGYRNERTFYYTVTEGGTADGVTNDENATRTIAVTVTDEMLGDGELKVELASASQGIDYQNTYQATGTARFFATKTLKNLPIEAGMFSFTLDGRNAGGTGVDTASVTNGSASVAGVAVASFPEVTYTLDDLTPNSQGGHDATTFTYTISEDIPRGAKREDNGTYTKDGISYTTSPQEVKVTVSDNGDGTLKVVYGEGEDKTDAYGGASFTNSYAARGSLELEAHKSLTGRGGRPIRAGEFEFELTGHNVSGDGQVVSNDADAKAAFHSVAYTIDDLRANADGSHADTTYTYIIREVTPEGAMTADGKTTHEGVTYDTTPKQVRVTLHDNQDGTIRVDVDGAVADGDAYAVAFSNNYDATGTADIKVQKSFGNHAWPGGQTFAFSIASPSDKLAPRDGQGNVVSEVRVSDTGAVSFGTISYELADLDRAYTSGAKKGVRYDDFTYTVREVVPDDARGVTYDTRAHALTVHVEDAGDGTLATSYGWAKESGWEQDGNAAIATITNSYDASVKIDLTGTKLIDVEGKNAGNFDFALEADAGAPAQKDTVASTDESGRFTFKSLEFALDDLRDEHIDANGVKEHTFTYTISENAFAAKDRPGYTKGDAASDVTVDITVSYDANTGVLTATPTYHRGDDQLTSATFTNSYKAEATLELAGTKTIATRNFRTGDEFTFAVYEVTQDEDGKTVETERSRGTAAYSKDVTGNAMPITFEPALSYTYDKDSQNDGVIGTHTYVVRETAAKPNTVQVSTQTYSFTVKVEDAGDGTLRLTPRGQGVLDGDVCGLDFRNGYEAAGSITFAGTKTLSGRALTETDVFSFRVTEVDEKGKPVEGGFEATVPNVVTTGEAAKISYPTIHYTIDDLWAGGTLAESRTYHYLVSELETEVAGIMRDERTYTVDVTIKDNGDGTLDVVTSGNAKKLDFVNAYVGTCEVELKVTKIFGKLSWPQGLTFDFELSADKGTPMPEVTTVQGVGAEEKTKSFGTITYSIDDLKQVSATTGRACGDFTYVVREIVPDDPLDITYDKKDHAVVVHVEDAGDGTLAASFDFADDAAWTHDGDTATVTITNSHGRDYRIVNVDEQDNKQLGGATLTLYGRFMGPDGKEFIGEITVMSDGNSTETVDGYQLIPGETYVLVNTQTPLGYAYFDPVSIMIGPNGFEFPSGSDGGTSATVNGHTLIVAEKPVTLSVKKTNRAGTEIKASEAQFAVSPVGSAILANHEDERGTITAAASDLESVLSGHLCVSKLHYEDGKDKKLVTKVPADASVYALREVMPPAGYQVEVDVIYVVLDEYGSVYLLKKVADGYEIDKAAYGTDVSKSGDHEIMVKNPTIVVRIKRDKTDKEADKFEYRIVGEFADGTTTKTITLETGTEMLLDGVLTAGKTYTITDTAVKGDEKTEGKTHTFKVDKDGTITFVGDPGGYTAERVFDDTLDQHVSVLTHGKEKESTTTGPSTQRKTDTTNTTIDNTLTTHGFPSTIPPLVDYSYWPWTYPVLDTDLRTVSNTQTDFSSTSATSNQGGTATGTLSESLPNYVTPVSGTTYTYDPGVVTTVTQSTPATTVMYDYGTADDGTTRMPLSQTGDPIGDLVIANAAMGLGASSLFAGVYRRRRRRK